MSSDFTRLADLLDKGSDLVEALRLVAGNAVNKDSLGNTIVVPGAYAVDAFGRMRVSSPQTLFDSKQTHNNQPYFWDDSEVSGGSTTSTWTQATASTVIAVAATTAGKRVRQTFRRFNYQPGKSQLVFMTGTIGTGGAGITRAMGLFDDENGIFVQDNEGTVRFVVRSKATGSVVEETASQSLWNMDKLDGTGSSRVTLDATKSQILVIDMEWLGVGSVRIGFVVDGAIIYCHTFHHANSVAGAYMTTPNLPLRYEIANDGTGAASSLEHICSTVISEGGSQDIGINRCDSNQTTQVEAATAGTIHALCGIRLNASHLDAVVKIVQKSVLETNAVDYEWMLIINPTIAGAAPTYTQATNSVVDFAVGVAANEVTLGATSVVIIAGYVKGGKESGATDAGLDTAQLIGSNIAGTVDTLWLCARPIAANADFLGSIAWREIS